jgi:hypothetical protein
MIKKTFAAALLAVIALAPAGCKKKDQVPPGEPPMPVAAKADDRAILRSSLGFAARVPSDAEGYCAALNMGGLADAIGRSAWAKDFMAGFAGAQAAPGAGPGGSPLDQIKSNPGAQETMKLARALAGTECFMVQTPGCATKWIEWRAFLEEARMGRALGNLKQQKDAMAAFREAGPYMVARMGRLEVPPMIFGFKSASIRPDLDAKIETWLQKLPPGAERSQAAVAGMQSAQKVVFALEKMIAPEQRIRLETQLRETLGNPGLATDAVKRLLSRRLECVLGWADDYFILSVGSDSAHLRFAANEDQSLLALDGMRQGAPHFGHPVRFVSYASAEAIRPMLAGIRVTPFFERLRPMLEPILKTPDLNEIGAALGTLDKKSEALEPEKIDPLFLFGWVENGLRAEGYGGVHSPAFSQDRPQRITGSLPDGAVLWWRAAKNLDYDRRLGVWFEELCTVAWGLWHKYGVERLPEAQRPAYALSEQLVLPKLLEVYRITRDEFSKGLGPDEAFALDLKGKMPPLPNVAQALVEQPLLPRFTWLRSIADPAAIEKSAASYGAVMTQSMALMPPQVQMMGPLLTPVSAEREGMRFYTLPAITLQGDLVPHVAMGQALWAAGTSPEFTGAVARAAKLPGNEAFSEVALLEVATAPAADWLESVGAAASADPTGLVPNQPQVGGNIAKNLDGLKKVANGIRELGLKFAWRYGYEKGSPRESLSISIESPEPTPMPK